MFWCAVFLSAQWSEEEKEEEEEEEEEEEQAADLVGSAQQILSFDQEFLGRTFFMFEPPVFLFFRGFCRQIFLSFLSAKVPRKIWRLVYQVHCIGNFGISGEF